METPTEVEGCRKRQNEIIQPLLTGAYQLHMEILKISLLNNIHNSI